jgi:hypothetical protein
MDHSYEEIRRAAMDILAGRESCTYEPTQYRNLNSGVAQVLQKWDGNSSSNSAPLSLNDRDIFLEVFWDMFRQGIITLGINDSNPNFPWFKLSSFGKKILENEDIYFFHDLSSYETVIKENIPAIDELTLFYLNEAMQDFIVDCRLSASVMLGVALEYTLESLYAIIKQGTRYSSNFERIERERTLLKKFNLFKQKLENIRGDLDVEIQEDLDTNLHMIISLIRTYRNESGHPTGKVISREQCYVNLQLFIPCCKKIYELMDFFKNVESS